MLRRAVLALPLLPAPALAQGRPLRLLVAFPPGGASDLLARALAPGMAAALRRPVSVENQGGQSGRLALAALLRAPADGGLALVANDGLAALEALPYPGEAPRLAQVAPVSLLATGAMAVIVPRDSPLADAAAFARRLRDTPPPAIGVPGLASTQHFALEELALSLRLPVQPEYFRGAALLISELREGNVESGVLILGTVAEDVRQGRLRALAVTGAARSPAAPEVPTLAETVAPGFQAESWVGLFTRAGAPGQAELAEAAAASLRDPATARRLEGLGFVPRGDGPAAFGSLLQDTTRRFADLVRALRLVPEDRR